MKKTGKQKYVMGNKIAGNLHEAVTELHGITYKNELSLYSAHSIRVTPAVLIHQVKKYGSYI